MTDIQHIDVDSDDYIDAPAALRDYVKKLQRTNTRLSESNNELTGRVTATALTDVLGEFKNPERVKRDLLADNIDPLNKGAVDKWLEANADDYAKGAAPKPDQPDPEAEAEAAAHRQLQSTGELKQPADLSKIQAAMAEITPETSSDEVLAIYRKHGL